MAGIAATGGNGSVKLSLVAQHVWQVMICRPEQRNAVDLETAAALRDCFRRFDADKDAHVAVLCGAGGNFCAGADLKAIASDLGGAAGSRKMNDVEDLGPMGPTGLLLSKPVIAAVQGYAVAGGLELACWCDLRVVEETASFGVYCRRFGVPLIDGGTVRLPRLIGQSRAMDMILTGRTVAGPESFQFGLANRLVPTGTAIAAAIELATSLAAFPQQCMRQDRLSLIDQCGRPLQDALEKELHVYGRRSLSSEDFKSGPAKFVARKFSKI